MNLFPIMHPPPVSEPALIYQLPREPVYAFYDFFNGIHQRANAYQLQRIEGINPLGCEALLQRAFRSQNTSLITIRWQDDKQRRDALRDANAYLYHLDRLLAAFQPGIHCNANVRGFMIETKAYLHELILLLNPS